MFEIPLQSFGTIKITHPVNISLRSGNFMSENHELIKIFEKGIMNISTDMTYVWSCNCGNRCECTSLFDLDSVSYLCSDTNVCINSDVPLKIGQSYSYSTNCGVLHAYFNITITWESWT